MKRRMLSILTALALCLSLLPGTAFAAEYPPEPSVPPIPSMSSKPSVPSEPPASSEPDVPSGTMRAASLEARDMGTEITILPDSGYVFANGIPIVIKEDGGATRIYDEKGTLLSGDWDVTYWRIYGGWFDYGVVHYSDTSITMESGTVGDLFGGSYMGGLTGDTQIVICGGWVNFLCGAGFESTTVGNTSITISGGEVNTLYGGSYNSSSDGNTSVTLSKEGTVNFLCGGSLYGTLNGNTNVTLNGGRVGWAFGGGTESMVTGTATVTVNQGASVLGEQLFDSSAPVKGNVYGGGRDGTVNNAHVIYNGGDVGFLYGGGEYTVDGDGNPSLGCYCPNVCIEIRGPLDENSDGMMVYGGGFGGEVDSAEIKFYGTSYNSRNRSMDICGSGYGDTMGHIRFTIGSESDPGSLIFYAHNPLDGTSVVNSAEFDVDITHKGPKINALDGCDVTGKVSAYFHGDGDTNTDKTADIGLVEVDEVTVEGGCFVFPGDPPLPDHPNNVGKLNLDRLEIIDSRVIFYNLNEANITDLVCNGATACFETNGGMLVPVQVTNITAQNPIKLDRNGAPTAAIWENLVMFKGPGVGALVDNHQFVSAVEGYVPVKTEDGSGVKMGIADQRKQAILVPPHFDHSSYQYGDIITITVGLMEEPGNTPIVGEEIEILAGNDSRRQVLARATTGENGMADVVVPVNEALWGGEYTFLAVEYLGNDVYKGNSYAASLKEGDGTSGSIYLEITQVDIVLTSEIVEPVFTAVPSTSFATSPDAFYAAEVVWTPADATFQPEVEYTASIRLIPKQGYSVAPDRITSITYQGKILDKPNAVEVDGSLLLSNVARFTIPSIPVTGVTLEPDTLTLAVGDMFRLISEVLPSDAQSWDGDWDSSDPDVASVSSQGTVTAVSAGTATITVTVHAASGTYSADCIVTVHGWQTEWSSDKNYHWHACTDESCTEVKDRAEHSWDEGIVTTPPTETTAGEKNYTCTVCGRTKAEMIPPLGHTHHWQTEWSSDENYHWHACTDEGCTEVKVRAEHSWDEGIVTTPPTETTAGEKNYTCTVCGRTKAEMIPPLGYTHPSSPSSSGNSGSGNRVSTYVITIEKSEHGNVTSSKTNAVSNSTVTLTVTPDGGYMLDTLTVTDSRGNAIKLTAQGGSKYTFTMPSRAVIVKATFVPRLEDMEQPCDGSMDCPAHGFTDLGTVGTWYHEAVDYVLRNGLMNGYSNRIFGPDDNLTRAQFAQILYNKEGKHAVTGSSIFADVVDGLWYAPAVTWAAENGIVGGYGNGLFGPDDNITREQLAVMLWRYAGSPVSIDKELHFTDADKASGYALDALRWAVEDGILYGYGDGRLSPNGLATRAQVAQMLQNYLEKQL